MSFGALAFSTPWLLVALAALPALWWLLRFVPPPPRRFDFPAVRLLFGLLTPRTTPASAPLWLILLRLALAALLVLAASGPLWRRETAAPAPKLLVIDNGWAGAKSWEIKRHLALDLVRQAEREDQPVTLLATAPAAEGGPITAAGPMAASDARALVEALSPLPWPSDRKAARKSLDTVAHGRAMRVVWLSDGIEDGGAATLAAGLGTFGRVEILLPTAADIAQIVSAVSAEPAGAKIRLRRPAGGAAATGNVRALDEQGRSLAVLEAPWAEGESDLTVTARWPSELRNRVTRVTIDGEESSAATLLLDGRWSRHPVGLVDDGATDRIPLLDDLFYGEHALEGFAEARRGRIEELLQRPLSLLILPDREALSGEEHDRLKRWIEQGGTLVRFAGPRLAGNPDDLLPVHLRANERLLGSALSWAQPMSLAPMPDKGPFAGLKIPPDLTVSAQILAEPDLTLADKTWARLTDGTPLVSGAGLGKGWLVLIHTTAWPGWSNLPLSGLFPDMLRRLLDRSNGIAPDEGERALPILRQLDGFGRLGDPAPAAEAWPAKGAAQPGPRHPPGLYGDQNGRRAVNLGPLLPQIAPLSMPSGAVALAPDRLHADIDLAPPLLVAALLFLLADLAIAGGLRGPVLALLIALSSSQIIAASAAGAADPVAAALDARLGYLITGDTAIDETSRNGLDALSRQVTRRTTAILAEPAAVDPATDSLAVYPLLYWALPGQARSLTPAARDHLNEFMRRGGLLVIDSRDGGTVAPAVLRTITEGLDIPPLRPVTDQHVLARSFYLLRDFPGRLDGAALFAEQGGDAAHDFVSPILIGGNDWAGAWATDRLGGALQPAVPGGEAQREIAYRFGINMVIYALTGSYKADQVHVPAILERMHR